MWRVNSFDLAPINFMVFPRYGLSDKNNHDHWHISGLYVGCFMLLVLTIEVETKCPALLSLFSCILSQISLKFNTSSKHISRAQLRQSINWISLLTKTCVFQLGWDGTKHHCMVQTFHYISFNECIYIMLSYFNILHASMAVQWCYIRAKYICIWQSTSCVSILL